jgi:thiamine-phosphate diphosphorylase
MLVTDRRLTGEDRLLRVVEQAVRGGVEAVQVREKDLPDEPLERLVRAVREAVGDRAQVILNDRPHLAQALGTGLHLPEDVLRPEGDWPIWGRSVHTAERAALAAAERPHYLIAGPVFATDSKPGHPPLGPAGFRRIVACAGGVPVLAIGGITPPRVPEVVAAGAWGVAVRGAILRAGDPEDAARSLQKALTATSAPPPRRGREGPVV